MTFFWTSCVVGSSWLAVVYSLPLSFTWDSLGRGGGTIGGGSGGGGDAGGVRRVQPVPPEPRLLSLVTAPHKGIAL
ncbi:hypothetical protein M0804_002096 [Polistes exclamans]|nr:hypothetical protein M0804_002096 [Polistes exclamans]